MAWPAVAAVVIGAVGLISNFLGSKKAAGAAEEQAAEEARLEGLVTQEKIRQLRVDERTLYGETLAGFASGGVLANAPTLAGEVRPQVGSPQVVLEEQAKTFEQQRLITEQVGASKVQQSLMHGENVAEAYKWGGRGAALSGISSILANYSAMTK